MDFPRAVLRRAWRAAAVLTATIVVALPAQTTAFGRLVARLSEPGGYFNTDNLVSNETAYLHVLPGLKALGVRGGAYIGVGPEQNFSYIADIQPDIAFIIDIRRDNMLLHLLLKAVFETAHNRLEYLCLLYGRPAPGDLAAWDDRDLGALIGYIDHTPMAAAPFARTRQRLMARIATYGVPLSADDLATISRYHEAFASAGLDLKFVTLGRPPTRNYPTERRLYQETDATGHEASFLASEARWQRVKALEAADRVVPVVGDLAGPKAVRAIGAWLRQSHQTVSAYYVSNVEMYLMRQGQFADYVANVRALPSGPHSVFIRSWFERGGVLPNAPSGHFSTQLLQTFPQFLALTKQPGSVSYWSLVTDTALVGGRR